MRLCGFPKQMIDNMTVEEKAHFGLPLSAEKVLNYINHLECEFEFEKDSAYQNGYEKGYDEGLDRVLSSI